MHIEPMSLLQHALQPIKLLIEDERMRVLLGMLVGMSPTSKLIKHYTHTACTLPSVTRKVAKYVNGQEKWIEEDYSILATVCICFTKNWKFALRSTSYSISPTATQDDTKPLILRSVVKGDQINTNGLY